MQHLHNVMSHESLFKHIQFEVSKVSKKWHKEQDLFQRAILDKNKQIGDLFMKEQQLKQKHERDLEQAQREAKT